MTTVDMVVGNERLKDVELKVLDWYAPYERCPIQYKSGSPTLGLQRIVGLEKMKAVGPTGAKISRLSTEKLPYLVDDHNHPAVASSIPGWQQHGYDCPDGLIIRLNVSEYNFRRQNGNNVTNLYFRVRETGPLLQVRYSKGYGLPFLLRGRMDMLEENYIIQHKLITMTALNSIRKSFWSTFIVVDEVDKAHIDLSTLEKREITVDGETVAVQRNKPKRKISMI